MTPTAQHIVGHAVDDASNREHQGFLEVLPEDPLFRGVRVLIEEVIEALCTWQ